VTCSECFLAADSSIEAEVYVNKAGHELSDVISDADSTSASSKKNFNVKLRYMSTLARVLDSNRKFEAACEKYYELSNVTGGGVVASDLIQLLGCAVTTVILSKQSRNRSSLIALIAADPRLSQLDSIAEYKCHATLIRRMARNEIVSGKDVAGFEEGLKVHQRVKGEGGVSIVTNAVLGHNMNAVTRIYASIRFRDLGLILETSETKAQVLAAKMIQQGVLKGTIDQVDGVLMFDQGSDEGKDWEAGVRSFCDGLNEVADEVAELKKAGGKGEGGGDEMVQ
jgi:COP9 signalosome complex subunit 4